MHLFVCGGEYSDFKWQKRVAVRLCLVPTGPHSTAEHAFYLDIFVDYGSESCSGSGGGDRSSVDGELQYSGTRMHPGAFKQQGHFRYKS